MNASTPRVHLRRLTPQDITEDYLAWFRDEVVTAFLDVHHITYEEARSYLEDGEEQRIHFMYAIVHTETDQHIGNLKIGPVNWKHLYSDCVAVIGRRDFWGQGLATEAIGQGIRIAFDEMDLRKLSGGIIEGNEGSLKAYTRAGWVIEGRLKGHYLVDGEPRDRIQVSCFNPKYFPSV